MRIAICKLANVKEPICVPGDPGGRGGPVWSEVTGLAAGGGDDPDIASRDALVAHEATDEGDGFSVGRPAGNGDLQAVEGAGNVGGGEDNGGSWVRAIPGLRIETRGTRTRE